MRAEAVVKAAKESVTAKDIAEAPLVGRVPYDTFPARSEAPFTTSCKILHHTSGPWFKVSVIAPADPHFLSCASAVQCKGEQGPIQTY